MKGYAGAAKKRPRPSWSRYDLWLIGLWALAMLSCQVAAGADGASPAPAAASPAPATASPTPPAPVESIVVTAQKLSVENQIDRKVYTITSDPQSTFGSLSDVLSTIPSVDVDPDGNVSVRGDTNVLILIDGKPSTQLSGSAAGDNLQSIPAKDIERIEILTTPPAQFKADGAAGVINIITRRKHPQGASGSVQESLGSGGRYVLGADTSYSAGPLTAAFTGGYRHDYRQRLTQSDVIAPDPSSGQSLDSRSTLDERIHRAVPSLGLSATYALNGYQTLTGSVNWGERGGLRTYTQLNDSSTPTGVIMSSTRRLSSGHDPETDHDQKLGFTQKLHRPGETLDVSLHRSSSQQHEHYDYTNDSFIPPAPTFYNNLSFIEDHGTSELDTDYVLPFSKTRTLKLGYAFEQDDYKFGNVANNVDPLTGAQMPDPNLTNFFQFLQQIHAVYASYQLNYDTWNVLAGLRAELTRTDAQQLTSGVSNARRYGRLYPSLHVDRSLSDNATLSLGASRRVTRPDPQNLNPYVDYEFTPNLRAGNPNLLPQYTQSFEVGYSFEGRGPSYGLTGYYRLNRDSTTDLTEYLANGLSLTTKTNLPKNDSAGLEFNIAGHILRRLSYSLSGNLFHNQIDASALGIPGLQSTTGLSGKLKLDYRPTDDDSAQLAVTRTDRQLTPQGYVSAINIVNLGYKRQLKPDLTAVVTVTDLFNGQRAERFATTPTFTQTYQRITAGRILYVGVVYAFGSTKKDNRTNFEYAPSD